LGEGSQEEATKNQKGVHLELEKLLCAGMESAGRMETPNDRCYICSSPYPGVYRLNPSKFHDGSYFYTFILIFMRSKIAEPRALDP
jgi:hypothetical protein